MDHSNYQKRFFSGSVGNDEITHGLESEWARGEIWPFVALMRKRHELLDRIQDIVANPQRGKRIVVCNIFPDIRNVLCCAWVKLKGLRRRSFRIALLE